MHKKIIYPAVDMAVVVNILHVFVYVHRGKEFGHDVDFLLTVPGPGKEVGLLPAMIDQLRSQVL